MYSENEWGQLKKVIVGIADNAKIPSIDISLRTVNYADKQNTGDVAIGNYPSQVIDEANEDLEVFSNFLKNEKIEVIRPKNTNCEYYNYCPRDNVIIYKEKSIIAPMPIRARKNEWRAFSESLNNIVHNTVNQKDEYYNLNCIGNKDILALYESIPLFDAANIIRANNNLLYLVSNSGNEKGADLLQEIVGGSAKVHKLKNVYSYMHIDSTIAFLKEGLLLANPSRIKNKNVLPAPFNTWDIIWCPDPVDIGHYPGYCNASPWINMNLFSINSKLVVLEKNQHPLRKELEKYKIDCAMLPMRHQRTLGGGFHCVTLDLIRDVD